MVVLQRAHSAIVNVNVHKDILENSVKMSPHVLFVKTEVFPRIVHVTASMDSQAQIVMSVALALALITENANNVYTPK